jgi:phosphoglycolate phosphatase-like HAD superfamily hydrolase
MKHLIFDYDGVLIDSFDFHLNKYNELYGIGLTAKELRDIHNGNFYNNTLEKFKDIRFDEYAKQVAADEGNLALDPIARRILVQQTERGKNHLITSGWRVQVIPFLKNHNIEKLFTACLFREDGSSKYEKFLQLLKEQNTSSEECLFITDTLGDLQEAHKANILCIAVTFGFHDEKTLKDGNPEHIAHNWAEVEKIVNKL